MAEEEGPDQDQANGVDAAKESGHDIVREDLDDHEREIVSSHEVASARLVHEIIRQRGIDELERRLRDRPVALRDRHFYQ